MAAHLPQMRQSHILQGGRTGRGSFLTPVWRQRGLPTFLWINHALRALTASAHSSACLNGKNGEGSLATCDPAYSMCTQACQYVWPQLASEHTECVPRHGSSILLPARVCTACWSMSMGFSGASALGSWTLAPVPQPHVGNTNCDVHKS